MKRQSSRALRAELESAGASRAELDALLAVAANLRWLKPTVRPQLSEATQSHRSWRLLLPLGLSGFAGLMFGIVVVILSQTAVPGNVLYPVQKLSDGVAVRLHPNYRGTVMMKRAQEVKQLITDHASPDHVLAALADYRQEAAAYKKAAPANYPVLEYCKANLQQAAALAPAPEKQAINALLASLHAA